MRWTLRSLRLARLVFGAALLLAADGMAQGIPPQIEDRAGKTDPTQLQKERPLIDLRPVEKPKPEYEILTGPDQGIPPQEGIVIVPDEAAKPPSPPAKEQASPPKKKDN